MPILIAIWRSAPTVRFICFAILATGVFAFECLRNSVCSDDVKNLSQIWAVAPALVKLALRDDRRSQIDKEPPWKRIAKGLI